MSQSPDAASTSEPQAASQEEPITLEQAIDLLRPAGRAAVLAYHSGEDVIVKRCFRSAATGDCTCPPHLPCGCGARPTVRLLKQGANVNGADGDGGVRSASPGQYQWGAT